jgi:ferrous iron transport protein A
VRRRKGIIVKALGGCGIVRRLAEMGLTPGVKVKLLRKCAFHGPLEVEARGVTLALGYGVASKVFVKLLKVEENG